MALKATIFKAELQIADLDRHYFATHALTIAQHPSETDERMMMRLLAFARHADEALAFTRGISSDDEPDLWRKDLTGGIELWVDIGQPDERRIRRACGRAERVFVYCHSGHAAELWWRKSCATLGRFENLDVLNVPADAARALGRLAVRNMRLQCTLQDGQVWFTDGTNSVELGLDAWKTG